MKLGPKFKLELLHLGKHPCASCSCNLLSLVASCWCFFCSDKIYGGQDRVFQFLGGLANNEAHNDLFWFRPLLRGNRPTFSGLI
jgi:hypothetical protein